MTKLKLSILTLLTVLATSSIFISCSTEDDSVIETTDLKFSKFKEKFPNLSSNIAYENIQEVSNNKNNKSTDSEGVTFPVIDNEDVVGRYFGNINEDVAVYIDYSDYTNQITIYNVNNPSESKIYLMELDINTNSYVPIIPENEKTFWCVAECTLGTIAIALSDGPSPIMDVIAVAYQLSCLADCAT